MALQRSAAGTGSGGRDEQASAVAASAAERVRTEVAARLHDGPVQTLTAASLRVGLLRREVPEELRGRVADVEALLATSIAAIRAEMNELRPPTDLADQLTDALAGLLRRHDLADRLTVECDGGVPTTDPLALAAYRTVQAVIRAAPSTSGTIRIQVGADGSARVTIPLSDVALIEKFAGPGSGEGNVVVERGADGSSITIASAETTDTSETTDTTDTTDTGTSDAANGPLT